MEPASVVISWLKLVLGFTVTRRDSPLDSREKKRKALFRSRTETGSPRFRVTTNWIALHHAPYSNL